jgi:hypothetical protein
MSRDGTRCHKMVAQLEWKITGSPCGNISRARERVGIG